MVQTRVIGLTVDTSGLEEKVKDLELQLRQAKLDLKQATSGATSGRWSTGSSCSSSSGPELSLDEDEYFSEFAGRAVMRPNLLAQHLHMARNRSNISELAETAKLLPPDDERIDIGHVREDYLRQLGHLQVELSKLQSWVVETGAKLCVVFEGRDAAGKGGVINEFAEVLNPRVCRVVALPAPSEREKSQWYFQRYAAHLPAAGEIVLFDRSWYNRAGVEKVMGFCTDDEYDAFLQECPIFEKMLINSSIILRKYWLDIKQDVQDVRLGARIRNPTKRWKLSKMDLLSRSHWTDYTCARDRMFEATHRPDHGAAWHVVEARSKGLSRLNLIRHLLTSIDYWACAHDLPLDLEPLPKHAELDICKVEAPAAYEVVPCIYYRGERQDPDEGSRHLAKTSGLSP